MKNWNIHMRLSCLVLAIVMLFALTGCAESGNVADENTEATTSVVATETIAVTETEVVETTEATEEATEAETQPQEILPTQGEQVETEPSHGDSTDETEPAPGESTEATEPVPSEGNKEPEATEPPHEHDYTKTVTNPSCINKGYTTYKCACGDTYTADEVAAAGHDYKSEVIAPTTSAQGYTLHTCESCGASYKDNYTDKLPVETQPEETEPVGCQHSWQAVDHPEVGHEEHFVVCDCGYRCKTSAEWGAHAESYSLEDMLLYHGGHGSADIYIVDTPAHTEWICSECGAATTTKP